MNILSQIFGTDIYKDVVNGVDKLVLTDEERLDIHKQILEAYYPFKVTQRLISLTVLVPYVISFLMSQIMFIVGVFLSSDKIIQGSSVLLQNANQTFQNIVLIIVAFYFTGGVINSYKDVKQNNKN